LISAGEAGSPPERRTAQGHFDRLGDGPDSVTLSMQP
jgi:hypothetical protein